MSQLTPLLWSECLLGNSYFYCPFLPDRVQREQLAAIFRLMKEKSDTFGEMSEGDMKEQLKLYDI